MDAFFKPLVVFQKTCYETIKRKHPDKFHRYLKIIRRKKE